MSRVVELNTRNPLIGTWHDAEDISRVAFTFCAKGNEIAVSAIDTEDGEVLEIENVHWDGTKLSFSSTTKSTGRKAEHIFWMLDRERVKHQFVIKDAEIWIRKKDSD